MIGECFICGCYGVVERHHIFGGALRKKSERYGVHHNAKAMQKLHEYGQRKAMAENGWNIDDFRREFYKNYI